MNVIQRRSSSTFSLSLSHFLALSHSSRLLAPFLSLSLARSRSFFHAYTLFRTHSVSMSLFACSRAFTARNCACAPSARCTSASTHGARIWMDDPSRVMFFSTASSLKLDLFFGFLAHFVYLACWPMAVAWSLYWPTGSAAWHFTQLFSVYIFFKSSFV